MKILFMGTPEYAVPSLRALYEKHDILAVYSQPDRPSGRGHKLLSPAVKRAAEELSLKVHQPRCLRDPQEIDVLSSLAPDVIVVIAYGMLLPQNVLDIPVYGCLNAHGSLLPALRGASPIQEAILQGFETTGVTIMKMDVGMDTGDILLSESIDIKEQGFTAVSDRLAQLSAQLLIKALDRLEQGTLKGTPQDHTQATYTRKLSKADGLINFNDKAQSIVQRYLALQSWPGLYTYLDGVQMKILDLSSTPLAEALPGTVTAVGSTGIIVAAAEGSVVLKRIQMPGKKAMDVAQFLLGNKLEKGTKLGI